MTTRRALLPVAVSQVLSLMEAMVDCLDTRLALLAPEQQSVEQLVSGVVFPMMKALQPDNEASRGMSW